MKLNPENMFGLENPLVAFLAFGTLLTELSIMLYLSMSILDRRDLLPLQEKFQRFNRFLDGRYREIGFTFATLATTGSLYLSNGLGWTPCKLCWYQRIFMYPLVIIFGVSLLLDREKVSDYTLPLSLTGLAIAVYHYMIQFLPQLQSKGCSITSVSCEAKYTFYFGHITIPVMAAAAFAIIALVSYRNFWKD